VSRRRVVIDGIYTWHDEGPAFAARFIPRGSFVSGESGPNQKERERLKGKSFSRTAEGQRAYRERKRNAA